ncbi:hypothetical protein [Actinomycetospora aeridis]|uniref:Uncharacterized protein n=1 Tax=Actinomycetospora aeridis TaxID=3129231 RepID=A0ABU8N1S3_9PSEU
MTRYFTLDEEPQVRDFRLLEAALARPTTTVMGEDAYPTVPSKDAALASRIEALL